MVESRKTLHSAEEMKQYAADFVVGLVPREGAATIVGLSGDLGAGKTTFSQGLAAALGVVDAVQSPTFVIMKIYEVGNPVFREKFQKLIHIDAYRLDASLELLNLGFDTLAADPHNLIIIEWPERVDDMLPQHVTLSFAHATEGGSENDRTVEMLMK